MAGILINTVVALLSYLLEKELEKSANGSKQNAPGTTRSVESVEEKLAVICLGKREVCCAERDELFAKILDLLEKYNSRSFRIDEAPEEPKEVAVGGADFDELLSEMDREIIDRAEKDHPRPLRIVEEQEKSKDAAAPNATEEALGEPEPPRLVRSSPKRTLPPVAGRERDENQSLIAFVAASIVDIVKKEFEISEDGRVRRIRDPRSRRAFLDAGVSNHENDQNTVERKNDQYEEI
jgi:hypothetical protein